MDGENYKGAKTFATIEHLGTTFRIVRRRFGGKAGQGYWGGYWQLLLDDMPVTDMWVRGTIDVASWEYRERLERTFHVGDPDAQARMLKGLATVTSQRKEAA